MSLNNSNPGNPPMRPERRRSKRKSNWIYETLPLLYAGAGMLVLLNLDNSWGVFSGLTLISAGLLVWVMRKTYRKSSRQRKTVVGQTAPARRGSPDTEFKQLVWHKEYECGNPTIDTQHRYLFALGNSLLGAILDKQSKLDVEMLLDELIAEIARHFITEEALLAQSQHPMTPEHHESHRKLLARCKELSERFHRDELVAGDLFNFIAVDVVTRHILREDLKFLAHPTQQSTGHMP